MTVLQLIKEEPAYVEYIVPLEFIFRPVKKCHIYITTNRNSIRSLIEDYLVLLVSMYPVYRKLRETVVQSSIIIGQPMCWFIHIECDPSVIELTAQSLAQNIRQIFEDGIDPVPGSQLAVSKQTGYTRHVYLRHPILEVFWLYLGISATLSDIKEDLEEKYEEDHTLSDEILVVIRCYEETIARQQQPASFFIETSLIWLFPELHERLKALAISYQDLADPESLAIRTYESEDHSEQLIAIFADNVLYSFILKAIYDVVQEVLKQHDNNTMGRTSGWASHTTLTPETIRRFKDTYGYNPKS